MRDNHPPPVVVDEPDRSDVDGEARYGRKASMRRHSTTARPRARTLLIAGLVVLGALGLAGTGHAEPPDVEGTPCTGAARACVDLGAKKAWLIKDDKVVRGPVPIGPGGPGHETPVGDFTVDWKHIDHVSTEYDGAPMPYAVFFTQGGVAFHEGNTSGSSHGCVRLKHDDAKAFFEFLRIDDEVEVR
jgi:hypothetical protein